MRTGIAGTNRDRVLCWVVALLCLQAAACFRSLDVSKLKCDKKEDCPDGFTCREGRCARGDASSINDASHDVQALGSVDVAAATDANHDVPFSSIDGDDALPAELDSAGSEDLANGVACRSATQCTSRNCVDGVCCDSKCDGNCESCATGSCIASTTPRQPCDGSGICAGYCDEANTKTCTYPNSSTACSPQKCEAGHRTSKALCDGKGGCPTPLTITCDTGQCNADKTDCSGSCTATSCGTGTYCAGTTCATLKDQGEACAGDGECTTKHCIDGYCCESACTGNCQSCSATRGRCTSTTVPRRSCGGTGSCAGSCDGAKAECSFPAATTVCESAKCLDSTTSQAARTCDGKGLCAAGAPTSCQYACTSAGTCGSECQPSTMRCNSATGTRQQCSASGTWQDNACSATQVCSGAGICSCATGYSTCGGTGTCYNTSDDSRHCGPSCTNCTASGQSCAAGQCRCALGAPVCNACLGWDFETGTQAWIRDSDPTDYAGGGNGAMVPISSTTTVCPNATCPGSTRSLRVDMSMDMETTRTASVAVPLCQSGDAIDLNGRTISVHVYFAGDADFGALSVLQAKPWGLGGAQTVCNLMWGPLMTANAWLTGTCQFTESLQVNHVAIVVKNSGAPWSGTMYIDDVQIQ